MSRRAVVILSTIIAFGLAARVSAQNIWIGGVGNWNVAGNWSNGWVPLVGENVSIQTAGDIVSLNVAASIGDLSLSSDAQLNSGGPVTLTVAGNCTITTTGDFDQNIPLTMSGAGRTLTSAAQSFGNLTITGTITLGSAVTVNGNLTLTSGSLTSGANSLTIRGNLTEGGGTLTSTNTVTISGTAAQGLDFSTSSLNNLTINATGPVTFNSAVTVGATFTHTAGTIALNGNGLTVNGGASLGATIGNAGAAAAVQITGATTLTAATSITTNGGGITFGSTANGTTAGAETFTLVAGAGTINLNGAVGAVTRLGTLTISSVGTLNTLGLRASSIAVTATGTSTFGGALTVNQAAGISLTGTAININSTVTTTLNGGPVTVTNSGLLTIAATGDMTLDGAFTQNGTGLVTTSGDITTTGDIISFLRAVTLGGAVALNSAGGAITFSTTVNGGSNLTLAAGAGNITLTGIVGGVTRLGVLTFSSATNVNTAAVSATSIVQSAGTGTSTFGGALNTNTLAGIDLTGTNFAINSTVTTTAGGIVTVTNAGTLTIAAAADMNLTGAFTQDGAGSVTTSGDITTTADAISFLRAVTLAGAVALNSANGNITFSSTINGAQTLSLTAGTGAVTVTGIVGTSAVSATRLASFTVVSATSVALSSVFTTGAQSVTGTAITLNGPTYQATTAAAAISCTGAVGLGGGVTVTTNNGAITFSSTVNGTTAGVEALTLAAGTGNITLTGAAGGTVRLGVLTFSSATNVNTAAVSAASIVQSAGSGTSTFGGALDTSALAGISLTGTTININQTVTTTAGGIVTVTNAGTLTIAAAADMSLTGAFTQNGAGVVTTSGDITTTADAISFLRAVTLGGAVALNSANGNISFSSTINGAQALSLAAGTGAVAVSGVVGTSAVSANRLSGFTVVSAASVALSSVFTTGAQSVTGTAITLNGPTYQATTAAAGISYTGTVGLGGPVGVTTNDGAVSFSSTINNAQALTVAAGAGAVSLSGVVGGTAALSSLTVGGATITTAGIGGGAAGVSGATGLTATTSITFSGTTYNANAQSYDAGAAGNNLNMSAGATTTFSSSADAISFTGTVRLSAGTNLVVNTAGGTLAVGSIRGTAGETVTLNTGAAALTVNAAIGSGVEIGDVTLQSSDISLGGLVTSVGVVSFYTATGAATMGVGGGAGTYQLDDVDVANISAATLVRIGQAGVQSGLITVQPASFGAGVAGLEVNSNSGAGGVALDDAATGTALALPTAGTLTVQAGTGGVTATQATGANAELGTAAGGSVVISSVGAVGTAANRVQFAAGQGNVVVTVTGAGAAAYLSGVNVVSLGAVTTNGGAVNVTTQAGGMTIGAAVTTVGGAASFDTAGVGANPINLNANVATAGGAISFADPVVVGVNSTLSSAGGITFSSTVDALGAGAQSLDVTGGAVTIAGPVGATTALSALTVSGTNVSVGSIGGAGAGVAGATSVTATVAMTLSGTTYRANAQSYTSPGGYTITLSAGAPVSFISTDDAISFVTAGVRLANGSDISVTSGGGAISVAGGIDGTSSEDVSLASTGGGTNTVSVGPIGATVDSINTVALQGTVSVTLNGNISTSNLAGNTVTVTGPCLLAAGVTIDTDTAGVDGAISFTGTIDNTQTLSLVAGAGTVTVSGVVGGGTPLAGFTVVSAATAALSSVFTTGAQSVTGTAITLNGPTYQATTAAAGISYTGAVGLGGPVGVTTNNGNISFSSTINGAQALSLAAGTGAVAVSGVVGTSAVSANRLSGFTVVSAASVALSSVFTTGAQSVTGTAITLNGPTYQATTAAAGISYTGTVGLGGPVGVTTNDGAVSFSSTINNAQALTVAAGAGAVSLSGVVGGTAALSSLTVGGATITTAGIGGGAAGVSGATGLTATTSITFSGTTYNANAQSYDAGAAGNNLNMSAGATTTFSSSADAISFTGTVRLSAGTNLVVNTAGGTLAVGSIRGTAGETVTLNTGAAALTVNAAIGSGVEIGDVTLQSSDISLGGLVTSVGVVSFYTATGAATMGVGGGAGTYQLDDVDVANISAATLVRIGQAGVQSGLITVQPASFGAGVAGLEVNSNSGAGGVALDDAATGTALALPTAGTLTVQAGTGGVTATQATGANAELGTAAGGSVVISSVGAVGTAANRVQFAAGQGNVVVTVTGAGAAAYLSGVNVVSLGAVTTNGGAVNVTTQAGGMTIGAAVTTVGGAASFDTAGVGANPINLNANVATAGGAISFADPVVVGVNSTLSSAGGITFSSTVDALGAGVQSLDVTGGAVTVAGPVGATTALSALTVSGTNVSVGSIGGAGAGVAGATSVTATVAMTLSGTTYRANAQSYTSPGGYTITLSAGAPVSFISTDDAISFVTAGVRLANGSDISVTSGGGAISVLGGIDGTSSEDVSLVSTGGTTNTVSVGPIGATVDSINTVALQGTVSVTLNGNISTSNLAGNTVTVTGPCLLAAGVTIDTDTAGVDGNVDFTSTVNGVAGLTVTSGGATVRFGAGVTTVGAQAVTAATIQTNGTHQTTNTNITLTGNVVLQAATVLDTGAGAGNITVTGTVDGTAPGAQALGLTSGTGTINLQSAVGGGTSLSTLTVSAPTATARFGGNVTTVGAQSITATAIQTNGAHQTTNSAIDFNGAVTLQAATAASAGNGAVNFNNTVDGGFGLAVNTTGVTTFVGNVGGTTLLSSITTNAGGSVVPAALVRTTGNQTYNDGVSLVVGTVLQGATPIFASTVTGNGFDLTLNFTGDTTIDGATFTGIANLSSANGGTTYLTGNITTTGTQTYTDAVVITGPGASLVSGGTAISFASTVNGAAAGTQALAVNAGAATISFGNTVGTTSLASLAATAAAGITIRTTTTTGAQTFTGPVTLGAAAVLTTSGGNIAFSLTVDGAGLGLSLVPHAGTATVSGNVTNIGTLTLEDNTAASVGGTVIFNGSVQAASLATFARSYAIELNAGGTLTNFHTFLNTGNLTILNGFTFDAGAQKNAGLKRLAGLIVTTGDLLDFNTTPVTLIGNTTVNTGVGAISLGAVTGAFTLALTTSVNATIESMIDAGATLDLSSVTGGTVTVSGALTILALTTAVTGANIALSGGGSIQNAVMFNNTGNVAISNGFTFANGVLPPGGVYPALTSLAGAVSATAGSMDFGNTQITANCSLTSPVLTSIHTNLTLNAGTLTLGGALRVYGNLTIPAGTTLDDSGNFTITMDGNWSNTGGTFTSGTGTVIFTGTVAQSVNPGTSSFRNLTKQGAFTLSLLTSDLTVTGTLTIAVGGGTVDVGNLNFTIATLTNNGIFRLQGTQATQSITTMTMVAGTVQYYDGAVDGTIGLATFYSLQILGPARTFTLSQDITVGPAAGTGLLQISGGVLDVGGASHSITLRGSWDNAVGDAGFNSQSGSVIFAPPAGATISVSGQNTWFVFECQVQNVTIRFQNGIRQRIKNTIGATFRVRGTAGNNILITNTTDLLPDHWDFDLEPLAALDMVYVTVDCSDATPYYYIPVPPNVTITAPALVRCPGWQNTNSVIFSGTVDNNLNGKIDRLLVRTQFSLTRSAAAFSGFVVQVTGYTLTTVGGSAGAVYNWTDASLAANEFWIMLQELPTLDSWVTPTWEITANTTLNDSAVGDKYVPVGIHVAVDTVDPMIAYTLAVADKDQIYVQFTEPVTNGGVPLVAGDFAYNLASPLSRSVIGVSGYLLAMPGVLTATNIVQSDVVAPNRLSVPAATQDASGNPIVSNVHRVSDLGLGLVGDGMIEPTWAQDQIVTAAMTTGLGRIDTFDGSQWLRDQNITVTSHVHNNIAVTDVAPVTKLWFDVNVPASQTSTDGLWLPTYGTSLYNGLVPYEDPSPRSSTGTAGGVTPFAARVQRYAIPGSDSEIVDGARLEFLFEIIAGGAITRNLFCARVVDPSALDWYLHVVPWAFDIHEIRLQKGSVNILHNVINPDIGEIVTLQYLQPTAGAVTVNVFDLAGNLVQVLLRNPSQGAGDYLVTWDGKNKGGRAVARGIYFIRLVAPGIDETRKVLVVR